MRLRPGRLLRAAAAAAIDRVPQDAQLEDSGAAFSSTVTGSSDASSTTMTSSGRTVCAARLASARDSSAGRLCAGTTTLIERVQGRLHSTPIIAISRALTTLDVEGFRGDPAALGAHPADQFGPGDEPLHRFRERAGIARRHEHPLRPSITVSRQRARRS